MSMRRIRKLVLLAAALPLSALPQGRKLNQVSQSSTLDTSLRAPLTWNSITFSPFAGEQRPEWLLKPISSRASLITSWIPGEKKQGMLRYKVVIEDVSVRIDAEANQALVLNGIDYHAGLVKPDPAQETAKFLKRIENLQGVYALLYDKNGFVVRKIELAFTARIGDEGALESLEANSFLELPRADYEEVFRGGHWTLGWTEQ